MSVPNIRLHTSVGAGVHKPITFNFAPILQGDEVVASPVVTQVRRRGSGDLTLTSPTLSSDSKQVSTSITCPSDNTNGRWYLVCEATIGPYKRIVSASIEQA